MHAVHRQPCWPQGAPRREGISMKKTSMPAPSRRRRPESKTSAGSQPKHLYGRRKVPQRTLGQGARYAVASSPGRRSKGSKGSPSLQSDPKVTRGGTLLTGQLEAWKAIKSQLVRNYREPPAFPRRPDGRPWQVQIAGAGRFRLFVRPAPLPFPGQLLPFGPETAAGSCGGSGVHVGEGATAVGPIGVGS